MQLFKFFRFKHERQKIDLNDIELYQLSPTSYFEIMESSKPRRKSKSKKQEEDQEQVVAPTLEETPKEKKTVKFLRSQIVDDERKPIIVNLPIKEEDVLNVTSKATNFADTFFDYNAHMVEPCAYNENDDGLISHPEVLALHDVSTPANVCLQNSQTKEKTSVCHWCCHSIEGKSFGIPIKYVNKEFHTEGEFCCLECACAYNFNNFSRGDVVWERHNLLNLFAKDIGYQSEVHAAHPRKCLKMFGGNMTIEEFRSNHKKLVMELNVPMISKKGEMCEVNNFLKDTKTYFSMDSRLSRMNKLEQKRKDSTHANAGNNIIDRMQMRVT